MVSDAQPTLILRQLEKFAKNSKLLNQLNKDKDIIYDPEVKCQSISFSRVDNNGLERKVVFNGTKPQDFERLNKL